MSCGEFIPTPEQEAVINCEGAAFINACPGAGKTKVMVERAAGIFKDIPPGRGVAFLSFTKAAISELEARLRKRAVLPNPIYPSFLGTFDSFVWQFFVAPFGVSGSESRPCLIPDIEQRPVTPYDGAQSVPLYCFDRNTCIMDCNAAKLAGLNTARLKGYQIKQYETTVAKLRTRLNDCGQFSFDDARQLALARLEESGISGRLACALKGRFLEVIVDEAQDCNSDDLRIIEWLRNSGVPVKVICDPFQSIYQFRGGVTNELFAFREQFAEEERMQLSGNFRSTLNICKAIACLRPAVGGIQPDQALGHYKELPHAVYVLTYKGRGVSPLIGPCFAALLQHNGEEILASTIVSATRASAAKAVGKSDNHGSSAMTLRLAEAVMNFNFAPRYNSMKAAIEALHSIILEINGLLSDCTYHQYIQEQGINPLSWRSTAINLLRDLRFDRDRFVDVRAWHTHAKGQLSKHVSSEAVTLIGKKLKWNEGLSAILTAASSDGIAAQTIHSVKGLEFPAVCVVTTSKTLGSILDFLDTGVPDDKAEEARELYVAASRAQKLLAFAVPVNLSERFATHLRGHGANVVVITVEKMSGNS